MKMYDSYKDSGIEWIGEIPSHWKKSLFKRVIEKIKDGTHGTYSRVLEGRPFLSAKNVFNNGLVITDNESLISEQDYIEITKNGFPAFNDLLITCVGTIGRTWVYEYDVPYAFQRSVSFLRLNENGNPNYYKHLVESEFYQNQLQNLAKTSAQSGVYMSDLSNSIVLIPPIEEQTTIANYLDQKTTQLDDLIAKKERLIQLLEEERTAIINQAVTKGLDPTVPMKDSGIEWLGEIPAHWEVKQVKHIANIQGRVGYKGYTVSDLVSEGEGPYTLGAKHINKENQLDLSNPEFISWEKYYESPEIMVKKGDLLLTQRGTLGKVVYINNEIGEATINPSMVLLNKLKVEAEYLYFFFNSFYFKSWIDFTNTATAVPMISQEQLGNFKLILPPVEERNKLLEVISSKLAGVNKIKETVTKEIELLKEYKTALISEVVTGKVDIREEIINQQVAI